MSHCIPCPQCNHSVALIPAPSNFVPDSDFLSNELSDAPLLDAAIEEETRRQQAIQQNIRFFSGVLHALEEELSGSSSKLYNLKSVRSPFRRLPDELVIHIFLAAKDSYREDTFTRGNPIPATIRAVCRRWRNLAESTSALWTSLPLLGLNDLSYRRSMSAVSAAGTYLRLCGNRNVSIRFLTGHEDEDEDEDEDDALKFIESNASRVANLTLDVYFSGELPPASGMDAFKFDTLHSASIILYPGNYLEMRGADFDSMSVLRNAPNLQTLYLSMARWRRLPSFATPPIYHHLRFFVAESISETDAISLLAHFPNLERCVLSIRSPSKRQSDIQLALPKLTHIRIIDAAGRDNHWVEQRLSCASLARLAPPSIRHFSLWNTAVAGAGSLAHILSSHKSLEHLDLRKTRVRAEELIGVLKTLPVLRKLEIDWVHDFLSLFSAEVSQDPLPRNLPALSSLYIDDIDGDWQHDSMARLEKVIRWMMANPSFEEVHVQGSGRLISFPEPEEDEEGICECCLEIFTEMKELWEAWNDKDIPDNVCLRCVSFLSLIHPHHQTLECLQEMYEALHTRYRNMGDWFKYPSEVCDASACRPFHLLDIRKSPTRIPIYAGWKQR